MAEFNKYSLYGMNFKTEDFNKKDVIDDHIAFFNKCTELEDAKNYVVEKFAVTQGDHWIEFPELHKKCYILLNKDRVEFCALKNDTQYYGKGWLLHKEDAEIS